MLKSLEVIPNTIRPRVAIVPTVRYIRWRTALRGDPDFIPKAQDVSVVRRYLVAEAVLFLFIPAFAAAMARGYGAF